MEQEFTYIDKSGQSKQIKAKDSGSALNLLRTDASYNADPKSGVMPYIPKTTPPPQQPQQTTTPNPTTEVKETTVVKQPETTKTETTPTLSNEENSLNKLYSDYQLEAQRVTKAIDDVYNGVVPLSAGEQAQIDGLKQQFQRLIEQQELDNKSAKGIANIRGYQTGAAEYDPTFQTKTIGTIINAGINKVAELNIKMNAAVAELTRAFQDDDVTKIKTSWDIYKSAADKRAEELKGTIERTQKAIEAAQKAKEEADKNYYERYEKPIQELMKEASKNGATPQQLAAIYNSGSVEEAIANSGDLLFTGSGVIGEYLFYKREAERMGQTPLSFNAYSDMDANRKRPITNIVETGGYTKAQSSAIDQINSTISNNATYKKTQTMQTFADNIRTALSMGSGTGDIAAINQFQKVIDEGAVTRDQDVKLIQSSQSFANTLATKIKKLQKGDQLSQAQRAEILRLTDEMLANQQKALEKDAIVISQKQKADRFGVDINETVLGYLPGGFSMANDLIQKEERAKQSVLDMVKTNPNLKDVVRDLLADPNVSYIDILDEIR